jgi:hypothetical protein
VLTPDVLTILAIAVLGMAALVAYFVWLASDRRIEPRRAAHPPVGGARVAGSGAAPTLYDLPRHEPEVDSILVRPFVTHPLGLTLGHSTARPVLRPVPSGSPRAGRGVVLQMHRCATCRDGLAVGALAVCVWCGCPRGGSTRA